MSAAAVWAGGLRKSRTAAWKLSGSEAFRKIHAFRIRLSTASGASFSSSNTTDRMTGSSMSLSCSAEGQFVAGADLNLARVGHHRNLSDRLADFAGLVADVTPHASPHRAAKADERFEPARPCRTEKAMRSKSGPPPRRGDALAVPLDRREGRARQPHDRAGNGIVADEQVVAAAEHPHRHVVASGTRSGPRGSSSTVRG